MTNLRKPQSISLLNIKVVSENKSIPVDLYVSFWRQTFATKLVHYELVEHVTASGNFNIDGNRSLQGSSTPHENLSDASIVEIWEFFLFDGLLHFDGYALLSVASFHFLNF